ncbi:MAG: hypothetical protein JNL01_13640 [Bdellovibrionales bacterium]|nr:hypothetical protein [Bdellovibrionales bacterium]
MFKLKSFCRAGAYGASIWVAFSLAAQVAQAARQTQHPHKIGNIVGYLLYKPTGYDSNTNLYPTIIYLHGLGERAEGNGNNGEQLHKVDNTGLPQVLEQGLEIPFLVISPQQMWSWNGAGESIKTYIDYLKTQYRVDPNRLYVTGISDGGKGTWSYAGLYPNEVAAIVPVSTWQDGAFSESHWVTHAMPIWAAMGNGDTYGGMRNYVLAIANLGGDARHTLLTNATDGCGTCGHSASVWNKVYQGVSYNIYSWFLTKTRGGAPQPPANVAPVANAGSDTSIQLPTNSAPLAGSATDSDGTISTYAWTKVSGPSATIQNPGLASTLATGLLEGTYVFRLTVTDDDGATHSDDKTVTVAAATPEPSPSPSTPASGTVAKLALNPAMVTNESGKGDAGLLVDEQAISGDPLAGSGGAPITYWHVSYNAADFPASAYLDLGREMVITEVYLRDYQGEGAILVSSGTPGNWTQIISDPLSLYNQWRRHTQPPITTRYIRVTRLVNSGRMSELVLYGYPVNVAPVANAGIDQQITLPTNGLTLSGLATDSDGTIASYAWEKVSGGAATLSGTNSQNLALSGLVEGSYVFRLTATDNLGASHSDEVAVTVLPAPAPQVPVKVVLTPSMVTNESGKGDAGMLVDEQTLSGDPLAGTGGAPITYWHVSYNAADFPASAYIDLGREMTITDIYLRDYQGEGAILVSAGTPGSWTQIISDPMSLYNQWRRHTQPPLTTRYIRVTRLQNSGRMSEIVIYGY